MNRLFAIVGFIFALLIIQGCGDDYFQKQSFQNNEEIIASGRSLYLSYGCAVCHGVGGSGDGISVKNMYPPPRDFHNTASFLQGASVSAVRNSIKNGVNNGQSSMPAFNHLSEKELSLIANYIVSLSKGNDQPEK